MLKEIHEQPDAVAETVGDRVGGDTVELGDIGISDDELRELKRIVIVACGTSYHAGLIGRYAVEEWGRIPVEMDIASEYRYRNPVVGEGDLVIGITQSGETADTLAAMRLARSKGARVIALTNVMGSQATRDSDGVLFTRAGPEVSVAATKTFVAQAACMYMLGLKLAQVRETLDSESIRLLTEELRELPHLIQATVEKTDAAASEAAERFFAAECEFCLYLGRHIGLPVCLEGALKLKEISYIPADAYAAGEMKHGPIALLGERTPVIAVANDSPVLDKVLSNVAEVRARGAHVIAVATEGSDEVAATAEYVLWVPQTHWLLQPILAIVPLQLLAYRVARSRGLNVDQPRNLAKTVTVE
jgi:glucosamine--fructose-6-phosphate aminotransferase (isomerizing)